MAETCSLSALHVEDVLNRMIDNYSAMRGWGYRRKLSFFPGAPPGQGGGSQGQSNGQGLPNFPTGTTPGMPTTPGVPKECEGKPALEMSQCLMEYANAATGSGNGQSPGMPTTPGVPKECEGKSPLEMSLPAG